MSEWKEKPLKKVVDIRVSNVDKKIYPHKKLVKLCNYMDVYSNRYINSKISFSIGSSDANEILRFGLKIDDVIITKDSETPEDIAIPSVVTQKIEDLICGYHLAILRPNKNELDGKFLMFKLLQPEFKNYFFCVANGSTRYGLTIGDIEKASIKYPRLLVQQQISFILTILDSVIEKTQNTIRKFKAIKQGMLHDLFTRGIDMKTGKLRPKYEDAPELYKESKLGMIPKEWEEGTFNQICEINPNTSLPVKIKLDDEITFIKMENVSNDAKIVDYNVKIIKEVVKKGFTVFKDSDVLFAKITPCMENGKGALARNLKNNFGFGSTEFHVLRAFNENSILFIYFLSTSKMFRLNAEGKMVGSAGQQRVPSSFFYEYKMGIPSTDEQYEIGIRLNSIETKLQSEQNYLHKIQRLKAGLMGDLLTGRKEVKVREEE